MPSDIQLIREALVGAYPGIITRWREMHMDAIEALDRVENALRGIAEYGERYEFVIPAERMAKMARSVLGDRKNHA
jgi:hypothetical protein